MKTSGLNWHSKAVVRTFEMRGRPPCETVDKMVIGAGFDGVTPLVDCIHARIALKGLMLLDTGVDGAWLVRHKRGERAVPSGAMSVDGQSKPKNVLVSV